MTREHSDHVKRVAFLTGTRADYGKMQTLIKSLEATEGFEVEIIATGMHMLESYGYTINEIHKSGHKVVFPIFNQESSTSSKMDVVLANTIVPMSHYLNERKPDMLVVHGDRVETLAGAIAGALNDTLVAHIEGGEVSGTIDESIRHAVTKFSHLHFVSNENARTRILQLGEAEQAIFVIGSPEVDLMKSENLPPLSEVQQHYDIPFTEYSVLLFHPVTTETGNIGQQFEEVLSALEEHGGNVIAIRPNNDIGAEILVEALGRFAEKDNVVLYPSIRFKYFLTLMKNARFIIGNSSSGVREAPVFGVPSINIGTRQNNRSFCPSITHVEAKRENILEAIHSLPDRAPASIEFGEGDAGRRFTNILSQSEMWNLPRQKIFRDIPFSDI